jgi:hypothetical protein
VSLLLLLGSGSSEPVEPPAAPDGPFEPDVGLLTLARAAELSLDLPPRYRDGDPDIDAVVRCYAMEVDRQRVYVDSVVAQFFLRTADEIGLPLWEWLLGVTVAPVGQDVEQRRATIQAYRATLRSAGTGLWWEETVTRLVGPGWDYEEHVAGDATSPPEGTIRLTLPFPPSSGRYAQTELLLRRITEAHLDIVLAGSGSGAGFFLDQSQLDQEELQ